MAGIALSKFGIMPADFYDLTPVEFTHALDDYNRKEERQERFELEKMRLQTLYFVNCQIKDPITDVRQLMPFYWDEHQTFIPTDADWEYLDKISEKWQKP